MATRTKTGPYKRRAGRPAIGSVKRTIRMSETDYDYIAHLGLGSISLGIGQVCKLAREKTEVTK